MASLSKLLGHEIVKYCRIQILACMYGFVFYKLYTFGRSLSGASSCHAMDNETSVLLRSTKELLTDRLEVIWS